MTVTEFVPKDVFTTEVYPASKTRTTIAIMTKIATGTKMLSNAPTIGNQKGAVISKKQSQRVLK